MENLLNNPVEIYNQIWFFLEEGVKDRNSPFHTPTLITLENNVEWDSLYNSDKKLVVDFTATWCGPCQHIAPMFKDLSDEFKDLTFIKVDVDKFEDIVTDMNISCMPTFHFIYNQKILNTLSGADEDELKKYTLLLNEYLDHNSDSSLED